MIATCPAPPTPPPASGSLIRGQALPLAGDPRLGTAEIATAAGCGKNVLNRDLPEKDDLVLAHLQRFAEQIDGSMEAAVDGARGDPARALVAVVRQVARVATRGFRGCPFRNYLRERRTVRRAGPVRAKGIRAPQAGRPARG